MLASTFSTLYKLVSTVTNEKAQFKVATFTSKNLYKAAIIGFFH
jgi:hypothetical protein